MVTKCSHREKPLGRRRHGRPPEGHHHLCAHRLRPYPIDVPHLPYTVEDVIEQGVGAAEAGAAVLHLHARNPTDGSPTADPAVFAEYASGIKRRSDVVISISTGGGTGMTVQERLQGVLKLKPELCTLNLGTMNYEIGRAHV